MQQDIIGYITNQQFVYQIKINQTIPIMMKMMILLKNVMNVVVNVLREEILQIIIVMNVLKIRAENIYIILQ